MPKAYARRERGLTNLLLPEVEDHRPLFERVDEGVVVRCINNIQGAFTPLCINNQNFVIGEKVIGSEEEGTVDMLRLHLLLDSQRTSSAAAKEITADLVDGDFDKYFETPDTKTAVYDPSECVPAVYAAQVEANRKKLEATGWQLYKHTIYDAAQASVKPSYFNGKPMRQGKTRESFAFLYLRGTKRNVFVCPKNVIPFVIRELKALEITDYKVIETWKDLDGPQAWLEIISYNTLKKARKEKCAPIAGTANCPHCKNTLERRWKQEDGTYVWNSYGGYICRNPECVWTTKRPLPGSAWSAKDEKVIETVVHKGGYVDFLRAAANNGNAQVTTRHAELVTQILPKTTMETLVARSTWCPPLSRRVRNRWRGAIFDEIQAIKDGSTDTAKAALSLRKLSAVSGLTGTLMPNSPSEAFWPLVRIFGRNSSRFPYSRPSYFNDDFVRTLHVTHTGEKGYHKKLPGLRNIRKFHDLMGPLMIRRSNDDPLVVVSREEAGLKAPEVTPQPVICPPDPIQAVLLVKSLEDFQLKWKKYQTQLEQKAVDKQAVQIINTSFIISQMSRMKKLTTVPDYANELALKAGRPPIYTGHPGGGKMQFIHDICMTKVVNGEKVLVLSSYPQMRQLLAQNLSEFNPIAFEGGDCKKKRYAAFDRFESEDDPILIGSLKSIGLGTDLSGGGLCNTVVVVDLDWNPSVVWQAYSRILKPCPDERKCEVFMMLLDSSMDMTMYNTLYAKVHAQEMALDRKITSKKAMSFDAVSFIEQVMANQDKLTQYLQSIGMQELLTLPELDMFQVAEERIA